METKLSFSNDTEKEVFEVLSDILKRDIADLVKAPSVTTEIADNDKKLTERKELLNFLMKAKDAGELNDLHEKYVSFRLTKTFIKADLSYFYASFMKTFIFGQHHRAAFDDMHQNH
jgi:hypothetical protein